jgi:hypothetical protein
MTHLGLTAADTPARHLLDIGGWFAAGALIGGIHFLTLRWNARLFVGTRWPLLPLGIQLARFGLIAAALAFVATMFGVLPFLVTAAGILVARTAVIRWSVPS